MVCVCHNHKDKLQFLCELQLEQTSHITTVSSAEGVRPSKECPRYDWTASDSEAPNQDLWGVWSIHSLPLLPGSLWSRVVVPSIGQIDQLRNYLYSIELCVKKKF